MHGLFTGTKRWSDVGNEEETRVWMNLSDRRQPDSWGQAQNSSATRLESSFGSSHGSKPSRSQNETVVAPKLGWKQCFKFSSPT